MWLALAKLENYEEAKNVLNNAITTVPTDHLIWMSAAKLEEAQGNFQKVNDIVKRAFKKLTKIGVKLSRKVWLEETIQCELSGSPLVAQAIVKELMTYQLTDKDEKQKRLEWLANVDYCSENDAVESSRFILDLALELFPQKKKLWNKYIEVEQSKGTQTSQCEILQRASQKCDHF